MSGNLGNILKAAQEAKAESPRPPADENATPVPKAKPKRTSASAIAPPSSPGRAKSTDPDFTPLKVYVRKKTKTAATRKWEDEGGRDISDLVETLLTQYLSS